MIVKTRFGPRSMWPYARFELALGAVASGAAWLLVDRLGLSALAVPVALATVLGTAVAILLAVRVNTAYQRWWEASGAWAQIVAHSRTLVRVAVTVSASKPAADPDALRTFHRDVAARQIAFVVALRTALWAGSGADQREALRHLPEDDAARLRAVDNLPAALLVEQSRRVLRGFAEGLLTGFDNFQVEVALAGLAQQQALTERTRTQPVPAVYAVFSRYLVHLFVVVFPFALLSAVSAHRWIVVPATLVVAFAFRMVERIGAIVEQPFAGTAQDVPLTALTTLLERDLLELVGEPDRPPAPVPVAGYLH